MIRKIYPIVLSLVVLLLGACTSEKFFNEEVLDGKIGTRLSANSSNFTGMMDDESKIYTIDAFRFENGELKEIFQDLQADDLGVTYFKPSSLTGRVYFITNADNILSSLSFTLGNKEEDFLSLKASSSDMTVNGITMSGVMDLNNSISKVVDVELKRSVARIDIKSLFAGVEVYKVQINDLNKIGFVNENNSIAMSDIDREDLVFEYSNNPIKNTITKLAYVPEQPQGKYLVEVIFKVDDAWKKVTSYLNKIERNHIYELEVYGNGIDYSLSVNDGSWKIEDSSATIIPQVAIDVDASQLPEGFSVSATRDTLFIPYTKVENCSVMINSEENVTMHVVGSIHDTEVTVLNKGARTLTKQNQVSIKSPLKYPGGIYDYIYLDMKNPENEYVGRIVLAFSPNPIKMEGKIKFENSALCNFDGYIDGEMGRMILPEGWALSLEFENNEDNWAKIEPLEGNSYRILGGWKPNDPKATGTDQDVKLVVSKNGVKFDEYTVRRKNWGLPVVEINGVWWTKYNLIGNSKKFEDQISISKDKEFNNGNLYDYLSSCNEDELYKLVGVQYQGGNVEGLPLKCDENGKFYYEGIKSSAVNIGTLPSTEMTPVGYQLPTYKELRFFGIGDNNNLGYNKWTYNNGLGQKVTIEYKSRKVSFGGKEYGNIPFFRFTEENNTDNPFVMYGLGHQWGMNNGEITFEPVMLIFGMTESSNNAWTMESWITSGKGNWFKMVGHNAMKTRILRCIKTPVEYMY